MIFDHLFSGMFDGCKMLSPVWFLLNAVNLNPNSGSYLNGPLELFKVEWLFFLEVVNALGGRDAGAVNGDVEAAEAVARALQRGLNITLRRDLEHKDNV